MKSGPSQPPLPLGDRPVVVVAELIATAGLDILQDACFVDVAVGVSRTELLRRMAPAAALIVRSATTVDAELIEAAPDLRVIGRAGIGVDNVDVDTATGRGVLVVNAPHSNSISAAEHAMALLLSQARDLPRAHASLVGGAWDRSAFQGVELHGKVVGVLGLGKIGTLVARRCMAFDMEVMAYDPFVSAEQVRRMGVEPATLEEVLGSSDFVTVHLPKTKDTIGLLGKENLAKLKPGARLINTSRGGIVDEQALAEAIRSGRIGGAALDVFETEPTTSSPLFDLDSVVVTPHLAASTAEAQDKAGADTAHAVVAALRGELVMTAVNLDLGREVAEEAQGYLPLAEMLGKAFTGLAGGLPNRVVLRAEGRLASNDLSPLRLALLKGLFSAVATEPVTYVNAPAIARRSGLTVELESTEVETDYVSVLSVAGEVDGREVALAGSVARKGPMMVEILGHEVELPFSRHLLVVRNADRPGVIGRLGSFLGSENINIANMVVGRSRHNPDSAIMGLNVDQPLSFEQLEGLQHLAGIEAATYLDLG